MEPKVFLTTPGAGPLIRYTIAEARVCTPDGTSEVELGLIWQAEEVALREIYGSCRGEPVVFGYRVLARLHCHHGVSHDNTQFNFLSSLATTKRAGRCHSFTMYLLAAVYSVGLQDYFYPCMQLGHTFMVVVAAGAIAGIIDSGLQDNTIHVYTPGLTPVLPDNPTQCGWRTRRYIRQEDVDNKISRCGFTIVHGTSVPSVWCTLAAVRRINQGNHPALGPHVSRLMSELFLYRT